MSHLEIFLLGPMQVLRDGQPVARFGYAKVQALLAYLAVESDRPHQRDELAELFWPEHPRSIGRASLRQALAHLRRAIEEVSAQTPLIHTTRTTVQLIPATWYWLDLSAFRALLTPCHALAGVPYEDAVVSARRLHQALALYRGDFLAGFPLLDCPAFDEWVYMHQITLREQVLQALTHLAALHERHGEYAQAIQVVRRQIDIEAWNEAAHRMLMRLLYVSGERDAALAQFDQCCHAVRFHLDLPPEAETIALYTQMKAATAIPPVTRHQPALVLPAPAQIPAQPTPLVGCERELRTRWFRRIHALMLYHLASLAHEQHAAVDALELIAECLRIYREIGEGVFLPAALELLVTILQTNGWSDAATEVRAMLEVLHQTGAPPIDTLEMKPAIVEAGGPRPAEVAADRLYQDIDIVNFVETLLERVQA